MTRMLYLENRSNGDSEAYAIFTNGKKHLLMPGETYESGYDDGILEVRPVKVADEKDLSELSRTFYDARDEMAERFPELDGVIRKMLGMAPMSRKEVVQSMGMESESPVVMEEPTPEVKVASYDDATF